MKKRTPAERETARCTRLDLWPGDIVKVRVVVHNQVMYAGGIIDRVGPNKIRVAHTFCDGTTPKRWREIGDVILVKRPEKA